MAKLEYFVVNEISKIPDHVTHLDIRFNDDIPNDYFDGSNVTHLKLYILYNKKIKLPNKLEFIDFGEIYNQPLENLPPSLTRVKFGFIFNQSIDSLPDSVTHIKLGSKFNQKINKLPLNLIELKFNDLNIITSINKIPTCIDVIFVYEIIDNHVTIKSLEKIKRPFYIETYELPNINLRYKKVSRNKYLFNPPLNIKSARNI